MPSSNAPSFKYKPLKFFGLTLSITWAAYLIAAYFSFNPNLADFKYVFIFGALLAPPAVAASMVFGSGNDELKKDFWNRLTNLRLIKPGYLLAALLIMPCAVILGTGISLPFGGSVQQFAVAPGLSIAGVLISAVAAPVLEELGWRGYGVDSLSKEGRSLFTLTLIFAVLWAAWHVPLFFIKGYYHYELWQASPLYGINFLVSIFPIAFLGNWLYFHCGRSIPINMLFHCVLNLFFPLLQTEQATKCIVTALLMATAVIIALASYRSFWKKPSISCIHLLT